MKNSRRDFISKSVIAGAGLGLVSSAAMARNIKKQ